MVGKAEQRGRRRVRILVGHLRGVEPAGREVVQCQLVVSHLGGCVPQEGGHALALVAAHANGRKRLKLGVLARLVKDLAHEGGVMPHLQLPAEAGFAKLRSGLPHSR